MPSRKRFTKCEICGKRATRENHEKRAFMAKFPLDEDRCRQWVKFVGNEDLIHLPIEKLHLLKHVCADHFEHRDFNKIKSRLKKSAIPSKNLKAVPLPDEMLLDFPSHVYSNIDIATNHDPRAICDNEVSLSQVDAIAGPSNSEPRNVDDLEISHANQPSSSEQASTSNFQHVSNKAPQQATLPLSNTASIGTNKTTATLSLEERKIERSLAKLQTEVHSDHPYCKEKSLQSPFDVQPAIKDDCSKIDCDVMETGDPDTDADAFDDELPPSPVPEIVKTHEKVFSWQRTELIEADVPEDPTPVPQKPKLPDDVQTLSLFCDDELPIQSEPSVPAAAVPEDFKPRCKDCSAAIDGFSFWCVQCPRGALCGACAGGAAGGAHRAHYVLRPPRGAAQNQTQAVLAVIRQQLVMENLLTLYETDGDGVKMEVKQEPEEPSPPAAPASPDPLAVAPHPDSLTVGPHPDPLTIEVEPYPDAPIKKCVDEETDRHNFKRLQRIVSPTLIPNSTIKVKYDFQQKILKVPPNVLRGSKTIHTLSPGDLRSTDIIQATTSDFRGSQQKHDPSVRKSQRVHILTPSHLRSRGVKLVTSGKTRESQVLITAASNLGRSRSLNVPIRSQKVRTLTTGDLKSGVIQATTSNSRVSQGVRSRPMREPSEVMLRTVTSEAAVQLQPLTSSDIRKWSADRKRRKID